MNFTYNFLISFFYVGYVKYAPGTIASLIMLIIFFFIPNVFEIQLSILTLLLLLGFILCYYHSKISLEKDPSFIVIDEIVGMSISLFMLPKIFILYLISFILFRCLDIFKPFFINKSQKIDIGIGIMLDDIISGIITLCIIHLFINWIFLSLIIRIFFDIHAYVRKYIFSTI